MSLRKLVIGFDADDTLWHNESIFENAHGHYRALLAQYHDAPTVDRMLLATEMRNLKTYGYGIKGFTLSAIETAIHLTSGKISSGEIQKIIDLGREMLGHPVELFEGVTEVLSRLAVQHCLILITKGDLNDQERKLAKSGVAGHFRHIEILSEKNEAAYEAILQHHKIASKDFLMVGNSLKSDIIPVLELGGAGAYVPYRITWAAERVETLPKADGRFFQLETLKELDRVVEALS